MTTIEEALRLYDLTGVHPAADIFPMMTDQEAAALAEDAKEHGWHNPVVATSDGQLLDGRNRLIASVDIQTDVPIKRLNPPDPISWVISENMQRRHLTVVQRADAAAKATALREQLAAKQSPGGRPSKDAEKPQEPVPEVKQTRDQLGELFGVSGKTVDNMRAIQDEPDLHQEVMNGKKGIRPAATEARARKKTTQPKNKPEKPSPVMLQLSTHDGKKVEYPKPASKPTFNETKGDGISWAAWSWNPVTGCLHGCKYCYAREIATNERFKASYPIGFTPLFHNERLDAPANTTIPAKHRDNPAYRRVFVCSMADLYGRWVPNEWVQAVHSSMCANPDWQYITLTKFPARYAGLDMPPGAWVGTSVDEQKRVRIAEDAFRNIVDGVKVKWLSLEPLLAPLKFTDLSMFDWVVIGAQTQTRQPDGTVPAFAPPFEWVARIVAQAREAGCRIHLKPNLLGRTTPDYPGMQLLNEYPA